MESNFASAGTGDARNRNLELAVWKMLRAGMHMQMIADALGLAKDELAELSVPEPSKARPQ
jgi:Holliday junction resolvasome RuvABC endonuclease subunit